MNSRFLSSSDITKKTNFVLFIYKLSKKLYRRESPTYDYSNSKCYSKTIYAKLRFNSIISAFSHRYS